MDERNQQTVEVESEAILTKDFDHKGSADEETKKQSSKKGNDDVSSSEIASSTNGINDNLVENHSQVESDSITDEPDLSPHQEKSEDKSLDIENNSLSKEFHSGLLINEQTDKKNSVDSNSSLLVSQNTDSNILNSNGDVSATDDRNAGEDVSQEHAIKLQDVLLSREGGLSEIITTLEVSNENEIGNAEVLNRGNKKAKEEPKNERGNEKELFSMEEKDNLEEGEMEGREEREEINFTKVSLLNATISEVTHTNKFSDSRQGGERKEKWSDSVLEEESQNKNNSIQESSSQSNANTDLEEESISKSDNEVMDTEMVNCNEIEQIDLGENESQKDKEIDRIGIEMDSKEEEKEGEMAGGEVVVSEKLDKGEKISMEDEPGNSEEETITGDMGNQPESNSDKDKEVEVCIIPDDMIPRLSILSQNEGEGKKCEGAGADASKSDLLKNKKEDNKGEVDSCKARPVRNAAKLAGNKIKSLVENDLFCEEQVSSGGDAEGEGELQDNADETHKMCAHCREVKVCKYMMVQSDSTHYLCSEPCSGAFKSGQMDTEVSELENALGEFVRKCAQCHSKITMDDKCLFWETMDFCNEDCLGKYQTELGSSCANCKGSVESSSLGKYCVRFGYDVKQFCSATCLEEYKKGLKVCSYCQKDISTGAEGFLAPVGDKGQFKDFCTQSCMEKYERMSSNTPLPDVVEECAVCSNSKPVQVEVDLDGKTHKLCSEPCFAAFKFVNNITEGHCDMCRKYFDRAKTGNFTLFYDESPHSFCCKTCMNVYILANRKIVPCNWCKVKKYNFDMIKKVSANGQLTMMCSLNCLMLYQVSVNAVCSRRVKCDFCLSVTQAQYHLTMSDATIRNFCSYNCVMSFQVLKKRLDVGLGEDFASIAEELYALSNRYPKQPIDIIPGGDGLSSPIPTGGPKKIAPRRAQVESPCVPVISSVQSLASPSGPTSPSGRVPIPRADVNLVTQVAPSLAIPTTVAPIPAAPPPQVYQQIITKPPPAKQMKNKSVLCKPYSHTKGVSCRPHPCIKETQTDQSLNRKFLIPIPVPIYIPAPMHMFATPFPVPVPFPLPVPVPIFIPTTRNSAKGIFKEIKKIQEKIPTDPFEAELLMMAEMVAGEKKQDPTDSESEDGNDGDDGGDGTFSPENVDTSNTFGDDMLQMALKMASELEEPAVDMESVLTSNTITTSTQPAVDPNKALYASDPDDPDQVHVMSMNRGRKRSVRGSRNSAGGTPSKRGRRTSGSVDVPLLPPPEPVPPPRIEVEKPDANMCLKYTFGVNAWRHWVMQKNAELEKAAMTNRKIKLFKPELLQLTADELNFSLCLFVKEVRKPNGTEYAPDTIYYLCLGIQQYLFENGRIDNIFTDSYYEKFTDCLDEVAKKFAALYNDSQYIVTRVEEEHLWESKQLGAHSPHVLLSTLMFFNTKHFNLVTVEEHMQLSFSHIMKHWKRNPNTPGVAKVPGSRNVLLRFYPPQSALEANSRKKKVYEQQENEENPLRCPVKLYEFYLSKCPESVKTRNDVFYLLPERSCVPDSPVWYSTMALGKEPLMKMLHRVKMVKEINIALLSC